MDAKKIVLLTICLVLFSVVADRPASSSRRRIEELMWTRQQIKERDENIKRGTEIQDKKVADFEKRQAERRARNKQKQEQEALKLPHPVKPIRQTTSALNSRLSRLEQEVEVLSDIVEFLLERVAVLENPAQEIEAQENQGEAVIAPDRIKTLPAVSR